MSPRQVASSGNSPILQIVPSLDAGGAERTTIDIARALSRAGMRALVASQGGRLEGELRDAGGELIRMNLDTKNPLALLANAAALTRLVRTGKVALIHVRSRAPAWSALLAAKRTRVPLVATYHGIYNAGNAAKRFYNSVMVRGDAVIANSEWTAAHIRAAYGALPRRIVTIPRGLDLAHFDPARVTQARIAALRTAWGVAPDARVILLPGRITRWKGQHVFVAALAGLKARGALPAEVRAVIAGDPQGRETYLAEIRNAVAAAGLESLVAIADHVTDMPAAYLAADIVVSASTDPEAFGRVPPEAAAMGRAVIATDHGGARETVLPGRSGLLVKPGDAEALAEALTVLLAMTPGERAAMGAAGRSHIAARYTVERMAADTLALYRDLLAPNRSLP